jgi:hypothetical protein
LKNFADALGPLYASLDDAQKRRFAVLGRMTGPRPGWRRGREGGPGLNRPQRPGEERGKRRTEAPQGSDHAVGPMFGGLPLDAAAPAPTFRRGVIADYAHATPAASHARMREVGGTAR